MISLDAYNQLLEEFGFTSSWTFWAEPYNGNWKSKDSISDMDLFNDANICEFLNPDYVFVGLNPAVHDVVPHSILPWENFHSSDAKRSQDYKLRYALRDSRYWGSFITDVYTGIADTDSSSAMKKVNETATMESVNNIIKIREILGGTATIVAIGTKTYSILKKNLPGNIELGMITHYSSYINIDKYRETVLNQLKELENRKIE